MIKRLLKKYSGKVLKIEREADLVDDCNYMVYFKDHSVFGTSYPVRTLKEIDELMEDY